MSTNTSAEVVIENVYRIRLVCTNLTTTLSAISSYPRPPNKPGLQQIYPAKDACLAGACYADGIYYKDYAATVQPTDSDDELYLGPYVIDQHNVTRYCEHHISETCIQQHGGVDSCIESTVEAVLAGSAGSAAGSLEPGAIAGIVIGGKRMSWMACSEHSRSC